MRKYRPEIDGCGLSVVGPVREDNQDTIHLPDLECDSSSGILFALADGMGGYSHGALASLLAVQTFSDVLFARNGNPIPKGLRAGIEAANLKVLQTSQRLKAGRMGTTLTAAYVNGDMLSLAHVGDSRAYLIRDGRASCLTSDHTTVGDMVRSKLISADKVRTHAQRSVLTKALGLSLFVQADITQHRLKEGDCLILCSDGVWSVVEDEEFALVAEQSISVEDVGKYLIDLALERGTDDNASVIVFCLNRLIVVHDEAREQGTSTGWIQKLRKMTR